MRGLNKVTLIGNLGKDPEIQTLEGDIRVARFSLATSESYKDKAGQTQTEPRGNPTGWSRWSSPRKSSPSFASNFRATCQWEQWRRRLFQPDSEKRELATWRDPLDVDDVFHWLGWWAKNSKHYFPWSQLDPFNPLARSCQIKNICRHHYKRKTPACCHAGAFS